MSDEIKEEEKAKAEQEQNQKVLTLEQEIVNLKQELTNIKEVKETTKPQNEKSSSNVTEQFWERPLDVIGELIRQEIAGISDSLLAMQKMPYQNDKMFKKYEGEIDAMLEKNPQYKSQPKVIDSVYNMILGLHKDELKEEMRKDIFREIEEAKQNQVEGSSVSPSASSIKLSDEEKAVARQYGYTEEEYVNLGQITTLEEFEKLRKKK